MQLVADAPRLHPDDVEAIAVRVAGCRPRAPTPSPGAPGHRGTGAPGDRGTGGPGNDHAPCGRSALLVYKAGGDYAHAIKVRDPSRLVFVAGTDRACFQAGTDAGALDAELGWLRAGADGRHTAAASDHAARERSATALGSR
jgi:hypothetical protein